MSIKFKYIVLIFCCLLASERILSQTPIKFKGTSYYPIPSGLLPANNLNIAYKKEIKMGLKGGVHLEKLLRPLDFKKDLTIFIQEVLDSNSVVVLPNTSILINETGLKLNSGQVLIFQEESKLKVIPNASSHYAALIIDSVKNVKVYGPKIAGDRFEHLNDEGQWGFGIRIRGSSDIKILHPVIEDMWGDGIYIGAFKKVASTNVEIMKAVLDRNRRNGLSITSGFNIRIIDPIIANSAGQSPKAGLDIEPNSNADIIDSIVLENPVFYRNAIYGLVISLSKLGGPVTKHVNIIVNNPVVYGGKYGLAILGLYENQHDSKIDGNIQILNLTTYDAAIGVKQFAELKYDLNILMTGLNIYNRSKYNLRYLNETQMKSLQEEVKNRKGYTLELGNKK